MLNVFPPLKLEPECPILVWLRDIANQGLVARIA